jgi:hypothetical protein
MRRGIAMRQFFAALFALTLVTIPACALFTKQNARTVLDFLQIACVIQNATLGEAHVAQVCGIANELIPSLRELLAQQRAELAKARSEGAAMSRADGGAPDAAPFVLDAGVPRLTSP